MLKIKKWKKSWIFFLLFLAVFLWSGVGKVSAQAETVSEQEQAYIDALSELMQKGTVTKNMDAYSKVSQGKTGKKCMRKAAIMNRAALMAEGIDFLDSNWSQYYAVQKQGNHTVFNSTKIISRKKFRKRYQKILKGLKEVLSCVEPSMSRADKALAVYIYLAENTVYKDSKDSHTGYDVLVNHKGVCDGLANAYALALNTLGIPCAVVSNYSKNHSWNLVKLKGKWYFVDLTNGVNSEGHTGMTVSYESFLVGKKTFLKTHSGYQTKDIYGQGNSDGLNTRKIKIASGDYIKADSEMKSAIEGRTCLFYHKGYWYWISSDNQIKRSGIRGGKTSVFYTPGNDQYIGWIHKYNNYLLLSLNGGIYRMSFQGKRPVLLKYVKEAKKRKDIVGPLWHIIYVGGFKVNKKGKLIYYMCDFYGIRKGKTRIFLK